MAGKLALLLLALAVPAAPRRLAAEEPPKTPAIQQYYQEALDYYTKGDYRRAIGKWNEILKADSSQNTARTMILDARKQIVNITALHRARTLVCIGEGKYKEALLELQALLDQDPSEPQVSSLRTRLEELVKTLPGIVPVDKASRMAVIGLQGYLGMPEEFRPAFNGLRYARQLAPDDVRFKNLLDFLVSEHPGLAAEDEVPPGMTFMEYKHTLALHAIYDAKYHLAISTLREILALEPGDVTALKQLGSAYYSLGRPKEARSAWTRALRLAPKDPGLRKFLARVGGPG